jgi:hypothetical protein
MDYYALILSLVSLSIFIISLISYIKYKNLTSFTYLIPSFFNMLVFLLITFYLVPDQVLRTDLGRGGNLSLLIVILIWRRKALLGGLKHG